MSREILLVVDVMSREKNVSKDVIFAALELALNDGVWRRTGKRIGLKTGDPRLFATFDELQRAFEAHV